MNTLKFTTIVTVIFTATLHWPNPTKRTTPKKSRFQKVLRAVPVEFSGGHDTDPKDRGRPVVLVAGGLGVKPEVFREAFSHVKPAPAGTEPDPEQVRKNKAALMDALGKYGVTNEKLDTVSKLLPLRAQQGRNVADQGSQATLW